MNGFRMIQVHYIYCALYFYYYYYINSTSDHQALDSGSWGPLHEARRPRWRGDKCLLHSRVDALLSNISEACTGLPLQVGEH